MLHVAVFGINLALVWLYVLLMLRPYLRTLSNESRRIAELLSQLPAEVTCVLSR
jgi:hypothetical protein